jgi:hypothetical protein
MGNLSDQCVDTHTLYEYSVFLLAVGEEFSKYEDFRVDFTGLSHEILTYCKRGSMTIVQSEPVKIFSHELDICFKSLPQFRRILFFCSKTEFSKITPNIYISP